MKISVRWLNEYLEPANLTADEAQQVLTFAGFPIESAEPVEGTSDVCLDVEVTSNRGDVLSHIGVAREVAALTGRALKLPAANKTFAWGGPETPAPATSAGSHPWNDVGAACSIDNRVSDVCPLFTARVIVGVKVGPSPRWMVDALAAVGQRSINNVVDVTNFVAFEYGQPSHVFDLATLQRSPDGKHRVIVRAASKGEKLTLLDGKTVTLAGDELVVADDGPHGPRAVSLAGVMGGADTEVGGKTTDVLLEAATWAPVSVRRAARRFGIRTDASHRFERIVDPRTIDAAARRAAGLIVRVAGGRLVPGVIHAGSGRENAPLTQVRLRPARCRAMLGCELTAAKLQQVLESLEISAAPESGPGKSGAEPTLVCTIPSHRPDLEREIDLIEEAARIQGLDKLAVMDKLPTRVASPQPSESATRELGRVLTGAGFYEAITFTFVPTKHARAFLPAGLEALSVCDGRRVADPTVRPSALASLLACRRANQDAGNGPQGGADAELGVRLYEISSAIAQRAPERKGGRGELVESLRLSLIADACFPVGSKTIEQKQAAVRLVRGVIESCAQAMGGMDTKVEVRPLDAAPMPGFDSGACAEVRIGGRSAGYMGLISASVLGEHGLHLPLAAAELELDALVRLYPPRSLAHALPAFPAIERDLSLIVPEATAWGRIESLIASGSIDLLEGVRFMGVYRGPQAGAGRKSVTLRLKFRHDARTLRHEEVDPQMNAIGDAARRELGAEIRTA